MDQNVYSVVIPVYNSEPIVENTVAQTIEVFRQHNLKYEILLVNDGSKDRSWEKISELARKTEGVVAINFLKNYGQHTAVYCGIVHAKGDYLITMDDDLQNPPQEVIKLINKIKEGYDLVFGKFPVKRHGFSRKLGSKVIGYLNEKIFSKPKDITLTNFRIFTKATAERLKEYRTFYPYIPGLLLMFSSRVANTETEHHARMVGKSNYTIFTILKLVSRLLFNYSSYPLKVLSAVGIGVSLVSFLGGLVYILKSFFLGVNVQGWTTLVVLISFLSGFILIILGVMGEYLVRILNQLSASASYQVVDVVKRD